MDIYVSDLVKLEELFPILKEYNIGIEITNLSMPYVLDNSEIQCKQYKDKLKNEGINKISFHGPFLDLIPASIDSEIKKVTLNRFTCVYDIAKSFNSKHIVYHTGFIPKMHYPKLWLENSISFWNEFMKDKSNDIQILLENVLEDDCTMMLELVEKVSNPNFAVCLDIGHANASSSKSLENWIKGFNNKIKHIHLHNNNGIEDNHNGLNNGTIDVLKVLELTKTYCPNVSCTLEMFNIDDILDSIKLLKNSSCL